MGGTEVSTFRQRFSGCGGFTLIEVLVAFTILAFTTLAVQHAVTTALNGVAVSRDRLGAELVVLTLSTMPMMSDAAVQQPIVGILDGFSWTVDFAPLNLPNTPIIAGNGETIRWHPVRMTILVTKGSTRIRSEVIRLARVPTQ